MLLLAYFWLGALALVYISASAMALEKRTFEPISYGRLRQGSFLPDPNLSPISGKNFWQEIHKKRVFIDGSPIYFADTETGAFKLKRLQRGFEDFEKIHIYGNPEKGEPTLTIRKIANGEPVTKEAGERVHNYAKEIRWFQQTFGEPAAIVAYGYKLDPVKTGSWLAFKRTDSPPDWKEVWKGDPHPRLLSVREARKQLNKQRMLRISTADGRSLLGMRLLKDGTQEWSWRAEFRPSLGAG